MSESGINSFDEFLLFYLFSGFVIALLWAVLEADVVLGPIGDFAGRHARRLRVTRWLAPLGIVHVAFALVAYDASRFPNDELVSSTVDQDRRRAAVEATVFLAVGAVLFLLVAGPHLPVLQELPAADAISRRTPWE